MWSLDGPLGRLYGLSKPVSGVQLAAIKSGAVLGHADVAISPTQDGNRSQREHDIFSIQFGLHARAFGSRRQRKIQRRAQNDWIGHAHQVGNLRTKYFRLKQERRGVRPVAHRDLDVAAPLSKAVIVNSGERAWTRNTGNSGISENT